MVNATPDPWLTWIPCRQPRCEGMASRLDIKEMEGVGYEGEDVVLLMQKVVCPFCKTSYMFEIGSFGKEDLHGGI